MFQQRREPIASDRRDDPLPYSLFASSGYCGRGATKVPEEFVRCCEHDTEQARQLLVEGGRGEEEEREERRRTEEKEEKQEEMIIVSSGTHITPGHTHTAECGARMVAAA